MEQVAAALENEEGLSTETKDALRALVDAMRAERAQATTDAPDAFGRVPSASKGEIAKVVDEYLTARPPVREKSPWEDVLDRLQISGDLRLRHESTFQIDGRSDRNRERLRFR